MSLLVEIKKEFGLNSKGDKNKWLLNFQIKHEEYLLDKIMITRQTKKLSGYRVVIEIHKEKVD